MKSDNSEPPLIDIITILVWIVLLALIGIGVLIVLFPRPQDAESGPYKERVDSYVYQTRVVYRPKPYTLASIVDRIIYCESSNNPKAKNPRSSAYGLCQFLDKTWDYVEHKWNMNLDRYSPADQRYACERLYREEGGKHWRESWTCWHK